MHTFQETAGAFGGAATVIVGTIVFLTLFFKAIAWLSRQGAAPETMGVRGVVGKNHLVAVHLTNGRTFDGVRLIGFTNSQSAKAHLPFELNGMVILEDEQQQRYLVRAKDVKMIVVPPKV